MGIVKRASQIGAIMLIDAIVIVVVLAVFFLIVRPRPVERVVWNGLLS